MDVWQRLGIEKTDDERAIKRAYAKQLKITRPDEDPKYFQSLREARDKAISLAKYEFEYEWYGEEVPSSFSSVEKGDIDQELTSQLSDDPHHNPDLETEKNSIDTPIDNALKLELQNSELHSDEAYVLTLDESVSSPTNIEVQSAEFVQDRVISDVLDGSDNSHLVPSSEIINIKTNDKEFEGNASLHFQEISKIFAEDLSGNDFWNEEKWDLIFQTMHEWSFDQKYFFEEKLLDVIADHLPDLETASEADISKIQSVLYELDRNFLWNENFRKLFLKLSDEHASRLMKLINASKRPEAVRLRNSFYFYNNFPDLKEPEFDLYYGRENSGHKEYYRKCMKAGKTYLYIWNWKAFIFCNFFLAARDLKFKRGGMRLSNFSIFLGILYWLGLFLVLFGVGSGLLSYGWRFEFLLPGSLLLSLMHIFCGLWGNRLAVSSMANNFNTYLIERHSSDKDDSQANSLQPMRLLFDAVGQMKFGLSMRLLFLSLFIFIFTIKFIVLMNA